jgi:hypothetical protein
MRGMVALEHEGEIAKEKGGIWRWIHIDGAKARREVTRANSTDVKEYAVEYQKTKIS